MLELFDPTVLINALVGQGIALSLAIAWLNSKGKKLDKVTEDVHAIKNSIEKTDGRGYPLVYGKDEEMVKILGQLAESNSRQTELLAEIRSEQKEIRNDVANHMCPYSESAKNKKVD